MLKRCSPKKIPYPLFPIYTIPYPKNMEIWEDIFYIARECNFSCAYTVQRIRGEWFEQKQECCAQA